MYRQLVILLLIAVAAQATRFTNCGTGAPIEATVHAVTVQDCVDAVEGSCRFVKGRTYTIEVDATARSAATRLPYTAKATIFGIPVTLLSGDACESLTSGSCPASVGERFVFVKHVEITNTYPAIQTTLTVEVQDEANRRVICAGLRIEIANALDE